MCLCVYVCVRFSFLWKICVISVYAKDLTSYQLLSWHEMNCCAWWWCMHAIESALVFGTLILCLHALLTILTFFYMQILTHIVLAEIYLGSDWDHWLRPNRLSTHAYTPMVWEWGMGWNPIHSFELANSYRYCLLFCTWLEIYITIYLAIIKTVKITTLIVKIKIEIIIGDKVDIVDIKIKIIL